MDKIIYARMQTSEQLLRMSPISFMQIKYPGADTDATFPVPSFCHQISADEFEHQRAIGGQEPLTRLLEEIATNTEMSTKEKKKKLKRVEDILIFL